MHADICDPDDEIAVECFKSVLTQLGAKGTGKAWGLGVDVLELKIGESTLTVFSDPWSIDIEGSEKLVQQVLQLLNEQNS